MNKSYKNVLINVDQNFELPLASGIVQCVTFIEYNSTIYTTVFNPDTVTDTANYDKFTCLVRKSLTTM